MKTRLFHAIDTIPPQIGNGKGIYSGNRSTLGGKTMSDSLFLGKKRGDLYRHLEIIHTEFQRATPLFYGEIVRTALNETLNFPFAYANAPYRHYDDSFFHFLIPGTRNTQANEYGSSEQYDQFVDFLIFDAANGLHRADRAPGYVTTDELGRIGEICRTVATALDNFLERVNPETAGHYQQQLAALGLTTEHFDVARDAVAWSERIRDAAQQAVDLIDLALAKHYGRDVRHKEV